jgi:hypothetical protein
VPRAGRAKTRYAAFRSTPRPTFSRSGPRRHGALNGDLNSNPNPKGHGHGHGNGNGNGHRHRS